MANSKLNLSSSFTIILIIFLLPLSSSIISTSTDTSPSNDLICNSTPYPSLCKNNLPTNNAMDNVYDYGRFFVSKSLSKTRTFLSLIENFLYNSSGLTPGAIKALRDCHLLSELNIDFLSYSNQILINQNLTLSPSDTEYVHTLLSSTLTNTQTCLDSIQETASSWSYKDGVSIPLANDTKLHSVSLALFKEGWVHNTNKGPSYSPMSLGAFRYGRSQAFIMSDQAKAIFESSGLGRRLLQATNNGSDYIVVSDIVVVSQDGSGNFTTINDALAVAPNNSKSTDGYFLIYVTAGVYEEYVSIPKNNKYLFMLGDGINQTVITGNNSVAGGSTTFNSATFAVVAQGFVGMDLTIRNTAGAIMNQAVALRNGADMSTFYNCSFEGYQDTLYTHSQRQFYTECDIYGTVDFIFGNAAVVLQYCNMYPRLPRAGQFNAITAQGRTDLNQNTGISIQNCTITPASDLASANTTVNTYLGRPWKQYSTTVYLESYMDGFISPAGWSVWSGDFALSTLYYAEFNNFGPGSNTSARVTWPGYHIIGSTDAANFTVSNFISGDIWLPQTGVPYSSDL